MRRALPILIATVIGLALLLRYHTTPQPSFEVEQFTLPTDQETPSTSSPPEATTDSTVPTEPFEAGVCVSATGGDVVVDGPTDKNQYGDVRVRVHLTDGTITDVQTLKLPDHQVRSLRINYAAAPRLRSETLEAQSAAIDTVSGATYTSGSYRISLQGALDLVSHC